MSGARVALFCGLVLAAIFVCAPGSRRQFQLGQPIPSLSARSSVPTAYRQGAEFVHFAPLGQARDVGETRALAVLGGAFCALAMGMVSGKVATLATATVDAKTVKKLREATGAGMMDCKKALVEANGNEEEAAEALRSKGLASAAKKASRTAAEGIIEAYIHTGSKLGVMVELACETDFVAKNAEFKELARTVAMQIAACPSVEVVSASDIPSSFIEDEKRIESASEDLQGKPPEIVEKIVNGRVQKLVKTKLLLEQPYIRDSSMTVEEFLKSNTVKLGENIQVTRFTRFTHGQSAQEGKRPDCEEAAAAASP